MAKSLGAEALRELARNAAERDAAQSLDVSGILWLEHVNLVVGSRPLAERFYLDILGMSRDRSSSFHCNLGQQQFHLAENGDPPQRVTGSIGLVVPSVERVRRRVREALTDGTAAWKDTQFAILDDGGGDTLTLSCPWGNRFHLYDATAEEEGRRATGDSSPKMVRLHAEGGTHAAHRMAVRGQPGIRYIEVACPPNTTSALAQFYVDLLGCTVSAPKAGCLVVCVGPGVHLAYIEDEKLSQADLEAMQGVHICIYVHNFQALYDRLAARDLIWTNPRFTHLDSCDTWEEARLSRTLRFKDLIDLSSGEKLLELEHETRPVRHGQYLKVPFYEPK